MHDVYQVRDFVHRDNGFDLSTDRSLSPSPSVLLQAYLSDMLHNSPRQTITPVKAFVLKLTIFPLYQLSSPLTPNVSHIILTHH